MVEDNFTNTADLVKKDIEEYKNNNLGIMPETEGENDLAESILNPTQKA